MTDNVTPLPQSAPEEPRKRIPGLPATEGEALKRPADDRAVKEAQQLSSGRTLEQLEEDSKRAEIGRTEAFRTLFDDIMKTGIKLAFGFACYFGFVWVYHLSMPTAWHWLTTEQINHIQTIFTGGVIASFLVEHFRKRLG